MSAKRSIVFVSPSQRASVESKMLDRVKKNPENGCWEWQSGKNTNGYGTSGIGFERNTKILAHRVFYVLFCGPLKDECVLHACDNPPCCNPAHLVAGTQVDNVADMKTKGRQRSLTGDESPCAKITKKDVPLIREKYKAGRNLTEIGKEHGIGKQSVWLIATGRKWGHIPGAVKHRRHSSRWHGSKEKVNESS